MPRLTPQELTEARRRKAAQEEAELAAQAEREGEEAQKEAEAEEARAAERAVWYERQARHGRLTTITAALYEEIDKLTRKAPKEHLSQLAFEKVNTVIRTAKDLTKDHADEFTADIRELVQAGDMPEYRDALLTLREVSEALNRFRKIIERQIVKLAPPVKEEAASSSYVPSYARTRRRY